MDYAAAVDGLPPAAAWQRGRDLPAPPPVPAGTVNTAKAENALILFYADVLILNLIINYIITFFLKSINTFNTKFLKPNLIINDIIILFKKNKNINIFLKTEFLILDLIINDIIQSLLKILLIVDNEFYTE